jgi:hypothetical protein
MQTLQRLETRTKIFVGFGRLICPQTNKSLNLQRSRVIETDFTLSLSPDIVSSCTLALARHRQLLQSRSHALLSIATSVNIFVFWHANVACMIFFTRKAEHGRARRKREETRQLSCAESNYPHCWHMIPPVTPRARSIQPSACTAVHVVNESQSALTVTWAKNNRCHS